LIQILGLRPTWDSKKNLFENKEVFFDKGWRANSVRDLFADLESHLRHIPVEERWNLFYTAHHVFDQPGRKFERTDHLYFDIDKVELMTEERAAQIGRIVCMTIGVPYQETGIVYSGNGTHIIVGLKDPITGPEFFDRYRGHYRALLDKIEAELHRQGFVGAKADPAIFNKALIMRLPGTENRKPDKNNGEKFPGPIDPTIGGLKIRKPVRLVQNFIQSQSFILKDRSGLPDIPSEDHVAPSALKRFPHPDTDAVLAGCEFLKHCKVQPNSISEAEWYASLSILGNVYGQKPEDLKKARDLVHEYSRGHGSYSKAETDAKLDQALASSGPRTCKNVDSLWGQCKVCPHYQTTLVSPIMIRSEKYIRTEFTGFHAEKITSQGHVTVGKPSFEDLRRFFERDHPYVTVASSIFTWKKTHWEEVPEYTLKAFAYEHFNPKPTERMSREFITTLLSTNQKRPNWFVDSITRKMNFKNGVLDIDTMDFKEHSQEFGFRYTLPYDYDPKATAPRFEQFLMEVTCERIDLAHILLEFAGYAFSNDTCWMQKAIILTGTGSNGKSIFLNVLKSLAGVNNYGALNLAETNDATNRQLIEGKPFNVSEETPTKSLVDSSSFKNLVAGGEMRVRPLYKIPYVVENRTKFIVSCNELPTSFDTTHALLRRLIIVPFDAKFAPGQEGFDPHILIKLKQELPGIFNLVIDGYKRLKAQGAFTHSEATMSQLDEYRASIDPVLPWKQENLDVQVFSEDSEVFSQGIDWYQDFVMYCEARGIRPIPYNTFMKRVNDLVPDMKKRHKQKRMDRKREWGYVGIKLIDGKDDF
jgi:P4 family phage/plasmid primase-like protien